MTPQTIALHRLANQRLVQPEHDDPVEVVRTLLAVQSQDYAAAKWAIALRTTGTRDDAIERALSDGRLVRTHVLRPTWHIVAAEDIRWLLALTASRVLAASAGPHRRVGLDEAQFKRGNAALARALRGGEQLTRSELAAVLTRARLDVSEPQRLAYFLMRAELDALICNGARRGKQFTYALFDERVPPEKRRPRDEMLAELALRYFTTRGPATVHDLAWWSGLTVTDAKKGTELAKDLLSHETVEGRTLWFADAPPLPKRRTRHVHLLPNYDEFFIGFRDRSDVLLRADALTVPAPVGAPYTHVVAIDGQLVAGWRRDLVDGRVDVTLDPLATLSDAERKVVQRAAQKYASHLDLPLSLHWSGD
jgi:hypothetical protein